ncbi:MAG: MoaD/ThiS family protein [Chloroflexi bacterium]|nr:MAG: MoaD/ThiS family protein [Chloroflexota bacterium]TME14100.1 MAG: MoaD/ThiS family protein [Chloroflexota bacterium]TME19137.1 MAG: MoaD/ThiS family protein [Chloroflexota bacterium]
MALVRIPGPLRTLSQGDSTVELKASDLRQAIEELDSRYPGFKDRLLDPSGNLRQFVNVYLNDEDVRFSGGLDAKLDPKDEVSIIPAVAGG